MAEALDDLQDSTSRLEAENRTLKKSASPTGRATASRSAGLGKVILVTLPFSVCNPEQSRDTLHSASARKMFVTVLMAGGNVVGEFLI